MKNLNYLAIIIITVFGGCYADTENTSGLSIRVFKDTPIWDLAKAVEHEDISKIEQLAKENKNLVNYQDTLYGATIIEWAVMNEKYDATEILLKLGANPNLRNYYDGRNALIEAADNNKNSKYLKLLLSNGADPNFNDLPKAVSKFPFTTPLITAALNSNLENVKMLVEAGANVNFKTPKGSTALKQAALMNQVYIVKYLLLDKHADFNYAFMTTITGKDLFLVDYMRDWPFDLESDKHKCKMKIVEFLRQNGMDYSKSPIPKKISESYPKKFIDNY